MKVELTDNTCTVTREKGDKAVPMTRSRQSWGGTEGPESNLLHRIKIALIAQGHDLIKKRMWKDGHMVGSDTMQYIRTRTPKNGWCVYHERHQIEDMAQMFNNYEPVKLLRVSL